MSWILAQPDDESRLAVANSLFLKTGQYKFNLSITLPVSDQHDLALAIA